MRDAFLAKKKCETQNITTNYAVVHSWKLECVDCVRWYMKTRFQCIWIRLLCFCCVLCVSFCFPFGEKNVKSQHHKNTQKMRQSAKWHTQKRKESARHKKPENLRPICKNPGKSVCNVGVVRQKKIREIKKLHQIIWKQLEPCAWRPTRGICRAVHGVRCTMRVTRRFLRCVWGVFVVYDFRLTFCCLFSYTVWRKWIVRSAWCI